MINNKEDFDFDDIDEVCDNVYVLKINDDFRGLIPKLTDEEYKGLEQNIIKNGCLDSIKVWNDNVIIDGHNRYEICKKNNINYDIELIKLGSDNEVKIWIINNQFDRRNINNFVRSELALKLKELISRKNKEYQGNRTDLIDNNNFLQNSAKSKDIIHDTREEISKIANVSHDTIHKVEKIKEAEKKGIIDKSDIDKLRTGVVSVNKIFSDVKKIEKIENRKNKINEQKKFDLPTNITLLEGDLFKVIDKIDDNSIDLLVTDPPYNILDLEWDNIDNIKEFNQKWTAKVFKKVKDTGRIYIVYNTDTFFDFYNLLKENNFYGFNFGNLIIWNYKNRNNMFDVKRYRYAFDPIFYLYGKNAKKLNFTEDTYGEIQTNVWTIAIPQSNFNEGKYHPSQKPLELFKRIIKTGSCDNDIVLDCFAGSGTTGMVCKELNRNCILVEKEQEYIDIIKGRVNEK